MSIGQAGSRRRAAHWKWLLGAGVLLGAGAWLMRSTEPPPRRPPPPVRIPRRMQPAEHARGLERRTFVAPQAATSADAGEGPREPPQPRDPLLALMPSKVERGAMVLELSAIMHSELGSMLMQCLFRGERAGSVLDQLRDAGFDPTTKLDRLAVIDGTMVVTGDFRDGRLAELIPDAGLVGRPYGSRGTLMEVARGDGGALHFGTWGDQMMLAGRTAEEVQAVLDRLEGRSVEPSSPGIFSEEDAYGEMYGVVTGDAMADVLGGRDERLAQLLRETAKELRLHVDVSRDVGLAADIRSADPTKTEELRKALGSALALARAQAQARGRDEEAALLDLAAVRSAEGGSSFRLEAGLPHSYLERALRDCVARGR